MKYFFSLAVYGLSLASFCLGFMAFLSFASFHLDKISVIVSIMAQNLGLILLVYATRSLYLYHANKTKLIKMSLAFNDLPHML